MNTNTKKWSKKNIFLVIGIFIVLSILIYDFFILRKGRNIIKTNNSKLEIVNNGITETIIEEKLKSKPEISEITSKIIDRFSKDSVYPYPEGRNIFLREEKDEVIDNLERVVIVPDIPKKEKNVKLDLTYNGYYVVDNERVGIIKKSSEVLLVKVGTKIDDTSFKVSSISSEKIKLKDYSNKKDYEIFMSK